MVDALHRYNISVHKSSVSGNAKKSSLAIRHRDLIVTE